ncbi:MAG: hypothetical protein Q8P16_02635 [bacterium]|nr:hypothetical protein [bacterium]
MLKNLSPDRSRAEYEIKTVRTRERYRDTATEDKPFLAGFCAATSAKQRAKHSSYICCGRF